MKEQIYFATKSKDSLTSELDSLADFPNVRYETAKVYEFYMKGIFFGGVRHLSRKQRVLKKRYLEQILFQHKWLSKSEVIGMV